MTAFLSRVISDCAVWPKEPGWTVEGVENPISLRARFFLSPRHPDRFWGHPALCPMGIGGGGGLSVRVKRPGREADRSPLASAEVKNTWIYTSTPPYAFLA
jgi:hypothetical protein